MVSVVFMVSAVSIGQVQAQIQTQFDTTQLNAGQLNTQVEVFSGPVPPPDVGAAPSGAPVEIRGRVLDSATNGGVARAHVTLSGGGRQTPLEVLTDDSGNFSVSNVPPSAYQLQASHRSYLQGFFGAQQSSSAFVNAMGPQSPPAVTMTLTPQAVVAGRVEDENGVPLANTQITLVRREVHRGRAQWMMGQGASTNVAGEFRVPQLPPGRYLVCASPSASPRMARRGLAYPITCFPGPPDLARGPLLEIVPGQRQEVHLPVQTAHGVHISGQLTPALQSSWMQLRIGSSAFPMQPQYQQKFDQASGSFEFSGVPEGEYVLTAQGQVPLTPEIRRVVNGSAEISVGGKDIQGLTIQMAPEAVLRGVVRTEDNSPVPRGFQLGLSETAAPGSSEFGGGGANYWDEKDPSLFRIPAGGMSGVCSLVVIPPQSYFVRSISMGGKDLLRERIKIGPEIQGETIEIVLAPGTGTIEAALPPLLPGTSPPNLPPLDLVLLHEVHGEWVTAVQMENFQPYGNMPFGNQFGNQFANNSGAPVTVPLANLAPGDYMLFAFPSNPPVEYSNPEVLRHFSSSGVPARVESNATTKIALKLPGVE